VVFFLAFVMLVPALAHMYPSSCERSLVTSLKDGFPLAVEEVSWGDVKSALNLQETSVLALYGAKSSGMTGINACISMGGCADNTTNFMDHPHSEVQPWLSVKPKLLSSHYDCAIEQYNRAIQLSTSNQLVLFPIRNAVNLIRSAIKQVLDRRCGGALDKACSVKLGPLLSLLRDKPHEMRWTSVDCLDFERLMHSMSVTEATVCFASVPNTNVLVKHLLEQEGKSLESSNVASTKRNLYVEVGNESMPIDVFLEANWVKIVAGVQYEIQAEYAWLQRQVEQEGQFFLCNRWNWMKDPKLLK